MLKDEIVDELVKDLQKSKKPKKEKDEEEEEEYKSEKEESTKKEEKETSELEESEEEDKYPFESKVTPPTSVEDFGVEFPCTATKNIISSQNCQGCMYNSAGDDKVDCQFPNAPNPSGEDPVEAQSSKRDEEEVQEEPKEKILPNAPTEPRPQASKKRAQGEQKDICPICGFVEEHTPGVAAREKVCPECGGTMISHVAKIAQEPIEEVEDISSEPYSTEKEDVTIDIENVPKEYEGIFSKAIRDEIGWIINTLEDAKDLELQVKEKKKAANERIEKLECDKAIHQLLKVQNFFLKLKTMTYHFFRTKKKDSVTAKKILTELYKLHPETEIWYKEIKAQLDEASGYKPYHKFERVKGNIEAGFFSDIWKKITEVSKNFLNKLERSANNIESLVKNASNKEELMGSKRLIAKDIKEDIVNEGDIVKIVADIKNESGDDIEGKVGEIIKINSNSTPKGEYHELFVACQDCEDEWHGKVYSDEVIKVEGQELDTEDVEQVAEQLAEEIAKKTKEKVEKKMKETKVVSSEEELTEKELELKDKLVANIKKRIAESYEEHVSQEEKRVKKPTKAEENELETHSKPTASRKRKKLSKQELVKARRISKRVKSDDEETEESLTDEEVIVKDKLVAKIRSKIAEEKEKEDKDDKDDKDLPDFLKKDKKDEDKDKDKKKDKKEDKDEDKNDKKKDKKEDKEEKSKKIKDMDEDDLRDLIVSIVTEVTKGAGPEPMLDDELDIGLEETEVAPEFDTKGPIEFPAELEVLENEELPMMASKEAEEVVKEINTEEKLLDAMYLAEIQRDLGVNDESVPYAEIAAELIENETHEGIKTKIEAYKKLPKKAVSRRHPTRVERGSTFSGIAAASQTKVTQEYNDASIEDELESMFIDTSPSE